LQNLVTSIIGLLSSLAGFIPLSQVIGRVGDLVGIKYFPAEPMKQQREGKDVKFD